MLRLPLPFVVGWRTVGKRRYFCRMNRALFLKMSALAVLLLAVLGFAQAVWPKTSGVAQNGRFSEKVNLALRRTAHHLLKESGDSTSNIPAIEHSKSGTWSVRLEHALNYDRLPVLLQESLDLHGIGQMNYDVQVLSCLDKVLQLGYAFTDLAQGSGAPCGGRSMEPGCYIIQISFAEAEQPDHRSAAAWGGLGLGVCGLLAAAWWWRMRQRPPSDLPPISDVPEAALRFGHCILDTSNQVLILGAARHNLTYREAKLLQLFAAHPNQVLERDFILKSVWEDEGIMVGRSVDVFVSRLRKMLREDPGLRLAAVHGVGYRLEVA